MAWWKRLLIKLGLVAAEELLGKAAKKVAK